MKENTTNNVIVTKADIFDSSAIEEIEKECFAIPWSEKSIKESMELENYIFLKAVVDDKVVGYVGLYIAVDEGDITNIAVCSEYRGKGIGGKLLSELLEECRKRELYSVNLEVRQGNEVAIKLYKKNGFKDIGIRKNFYQKPIENAVLMQMIF